VRVIGIAFSGFTRPKSVSRASRCPLSDSSMMPAVPLAFAGSPLGRGESYRGADLAVIDSTHLLVSATGDRAAVWWADLATRVVVPIQPFAGDVVPWSVVALPDGSRRVAVSVVRRDDLGGELALLTPESGRFDPSTVAIASTIARACGPSSRGAARWR